VSWLTRGGTRVAKSNDGGRSWTELPGLPPTATLNPYSVALAASEGGRLYAAFTHASGSDATFTTQGTYFGVLDGSEWKTRLLDSKGTAYPAIALQPATSAERIFVAYPAVENDDWQTPLLTWSDDGGTTWSRPITLDAPEAPGWILPTLAVDGQGRVWSGFFHPLPDGANEYRMAAFTTLALGPVRVNRASIGPQTLGLELGHYMGLAGTPQGAFAVWVSGTVPATDLQGAALTLGNE
jgi:hypothetical protein